MNMESIRELICFIFYFCIVNGVICYIVSSLFFVRPMSNKYKIMVSDLPNDIKGRYKYILFGIFIIGFYFYILSFFESKVFLGVVAFIHIAIGLYYFNKYRRWDILEYINYFSADLFDWDKIYTLNIPEDIKKCCFAIHNIDYETYGKTYLSHLKIKQCSLQYDIDKQIKKNECNYKE